MPIYAYRCENCGVQFERRQSFSDDPLVTCPECSEPALRKLIQPVGIVFKGSGFYVTDNRGKDGARAATSTSTTGSEAEKSESKGSASEAKPDSSDSSGASNSASAKDD
ncbi:MAG: FmdB family zinc ribbon protein [Anaerolineales bacterium]|nr:FmdB family zinc ribbon protein [Anaerolineales bacterium]